jgi:Integrase core domain
MDQIPTFTHPEYALYLAAEDIGRSWTNTKSPRTNGIVERLDKTMLNEFYRIAFRNTLCTSIAALQDDLDEWNRSYNEERPHQGGWCFGTPPSQTLLDAIPIAREKMICKGLDLSFQSLSREIATRHSSHGGEFGERIDAVKDASCARAGGAGAPHP